MADRASGPVGLSRGELFAGLCVLGFANGAIGRVQSDVLQDGLAVAIASTFNISAIVWVAFAVCPTMLLRAPREALRRADMIMAGCFLVVILLPISPLSWMGLTGIALYLLHNPFAPNAWRSHLHPAAWILLTTTGAMFWGRVLLHSASGPILTADAIMVGWLVGTETIGNTVRFANGEGFIWIAPGCSSLTNVSLAILCWVICAQVRGQRSATQGAAWCLLACLTVVAINVTRIALMARYPDYFDLLHGPTGANVASWLSITLVLAISMWGTRRAQPALA